jgi:AraC-like DNA-binding protein
MNESSQLPSYQRYAPSAALSGIVDVIWIQECGPKSGCVPTTIVPTGRVELIFHYGDPYVQYDNGDSSLMPMSHVVGQQKKPIVLSATGSTGIAIVRFTPWGAYALFGDALASINDQLVDLELLWEPQALRDLLNQLHEADDQHARARIADAFVVSRLVNARLDRLSMASINIINGSWGRRRVHEIAQQFELGRRQFTRRFTRSIGASPKQMSRVLRAQKAIACVRLGENIQNIIARCDYADQSHFVHEVADHCNRPPSELARLTASDAHRFFNSTDLAEFCGTTYL